MARGIAGPVGSLACNAERRECVLECEGEIDGPVPFTAAVRLRTRSARYGWNDVSHVSVLNNVGRDCMLEREREKERETSQTAAKPSQPTLFRNAAYPLRSKADPRGTCELRVP